MNYTNFKKGLIWILDSVKPEYTTEYDPDSDMGQKVTDILKPGFHKNSFEYTDPLQVLVGRMLFREDSQWIALSQLVSQRSSKSMGRYQC